MACVISGQKFAIISKYKSGRRIINENNELLHDGLLNSTVFASDKYDACR